MNEDLHHISEPFTAAEGWKQMQNLLDKHLPVKKPFNRWNFLRTSYAAASLLIILMFATISTSDSDDKNILINSSTHQLINNKQTKFSVVSQAKSETNIVGTTSTAIHLFVENTPELKNKVSSLASPIIINRLLPHAESIVDQHVKNIIPDTIVIKPLEKTDETAKAIPDTGASTAKKLRTNSKWNVYAGIGMNISTSANSQNLQPYPVVEAKYTISRHLFVSAGLAPYSPVAKHTSAKSETVYANDLVNNLAMYNEKTTYSSFHYADIPVTVGTNITKHLSIQGGMQMSILLNKKSEKSIEQYDFQMNRTDVPVFTSLMAATTNQPVKYNNEINKIDYRLLGGIRYNVNKFSAGLTYQQGISPIIKGNNNDGEKNKVVAFSLLYNIR